MLIDLIFLFSLVILLYVYCGYLIALKIVAFFTGTSLFNNEVFDNSYMPTITVLITAYNEEKTILKRVDNILKCPYSNTLEIIVASDGSTDSTDKIVNQIKDSRVKLFRPKNRLGKTETQNLAIQKSKGEIVIFTDSESSFDRQFLNNIVKYFSNDFVGCVSGRLCFESNKNSVSKNQGYYWSYETKLREIESSLGILAVASGACMAVRKSLFNPMSGSFGEDCVVPLDIVINKHKVIHAFDAIAYDWIDSDAKTEVSNRSRMTLRNWQGTWSKSIILNPFKYPGHSFSLWSHKILRWLSPVFIFLITFIAFNLSNESLFYFYALYILIFFYFMGLMGWLGLKNDVEIPIAASIYSFLLANFGFLYGLLRVIKKEDLKIYRN
jgi:glycosyltransferase involved in cell wall biosynthesis